MIVENKTDANGILSIPSSFADLIDVDMRNQFLTYKIKYKINAKSAIENNVNMVRISAYENEISSDIPLFLSDKVKFEDTQNFGRIGGIQSESFACSILLHNSRCKDLLLFNSVAPLVSIMSGITRVFNTPDEVKTITTLSLQQANKSNQNFPIYESSTKFADEAKELSTEDASTTLALTKNIVPFSFVDRIKTRNSTKTSLAGTLSGGGSLNNEENSLIKNTIGIGSVSTEDGSTKLENEDELVPVLARTEVKDKVISELLRIPIKGGFQNGAIFIRFDLINNKGKILQSIIKSVNQLATLNSFTAPVESPKLAVKSLDTSTNFISVKQEDKFASCIRIYKKVISEVEPGSSSDDEYKLIRDIRLKKGEGEFGFRDTNNNGVSTIYRAISFHKNQSSSNFSSAMPSFNKSLSSGACRRIKSVVLNTENQLNGISVEASNIPDAVIEIRLLRRDLTIKEKEFKLTKREHAKNSPQNVSLFLDDNVKEDHTYEYKVKLIYRDGIEILSPASSMQVFNKLSQNILDLDVSEPSINNIGKRSVQFTINSKFEESTIDIVKNKLIEDGTFDIFEDELKNDRENLSEVITHAIERHNLTTGEKEFLGTTSKSDFSDEEFSNKTGAKSLNKNHSYKYLISTQTRTPETLFENFEKTKTDEKTGNTYSFNPQKFLNPLSLKKGTLISKASLKLNHAKSDFSLGNLNNKKTIIVEGIADLPQIVSALASRSKPVRAKKSNLIKWKISGDRNQIDHFLVSVRILKQTSFAGKVHNISNSNNFMFRDLLEIGDVGRFVYIITPIYKNFSRGKSAETNEVIV